MINLLTKILKKWFDLTVSAYEPEMIRFIQRVKNPFANPVRHSISSGLEKIYDGIVKNMQIDSCLEGLEEIIKVRAVQSFKPSHALSFLYALKDIVREGLKKGDDIPTEELNRFDKYMDQIMGMAFDIYCDCREKIFDIRVAETVSRSRRAFGLLERRKEENR